MESVAVARDFGKVRNDFPVLQRTVNGKRLVYLDTAATSQKPNFVIDSINEYYRDHYSNVHRGVYALSVEATEAYEGSRTKIANFINAGHADELVFVRNATEGINLVAYTWARSNIEKNDTILATEMEHHSNLVPWQQTAMLLGSDLDFIKIDEDGLLVLDDLERAFSKKVKLLAITHVSNVLGTINPLKKIIKYAHDHGARVLVDAAQSAPHMPLDVQELDCDFLVISGHKMMGPDGIGVLYGKRELLQKMDPFLFGGDMIKEVHLRDAKWNDLPWKFEAGTPNVSGAIGLGAASDYLKELDMKAVRSHEKSLVEYSIDELSRIGDITIFGPKDSDIRGGVVSFNLDDIHPHDVASVLDAEGIAVRAGHHCAQPLMERLGVSATTRASFHVYNSRDDIDSLVEGLQKTKKVFKK